MTPPSPQDGLILRDIHLPPGPDWWPPAWGWWVLLAVGMALLAWFGPWLWRQFQLKRQRRQLLALLGQLERSGATVRGPEFLAQISQLLRRIALTRYPHQDVAPLSGTDWLRFLDVSGGGGRFERGAGRVLAEGPYRPELTEPLDTSALVMLVREWIDANTGGRRGA